MDLLACPVILPLPRIASLLFAIWEMCIFPLKTKLDTTSFGETLPAPSGRISQLLCSHIALPFGLTFVTARMCFFFNIYYALGTYHIVSTCLLVYLA